MTLTLELTPETEQRLKEEAARLGQSPSDIALWLVEEGMRTFLTAPVQAQSPSMSGTPQERAEAVRAWAASHPKDMPVLSDEAISRESIYGERG